MINTFQLTYLAVCLVSPKSGKPCRLPHVLRSFMPASHKRERILWGEGTSVENTPPLDWIVWWLTVSPRWGCRNYCCRARPTVITFPCLHLWQLWVSFLLSFFGQVLLCSLGWCGTHSPCASTSLVLGVVCTTVPGVLIIFKNFKILFYFWFVYRYVGISRVSSASRDQRMASNPLKLEL